MSRDEKRCGIYMYHWYSHKFEVNNMASVRPLHTAAGYLFTIGACFQVTWPPLQKISTTREHSSRFLRVGWISQPHIHHTKCPKQFSPPQKRQRARTRQAPVKGSSQGRTKSSCSPLEVSLSAWGILCETSKLCYRMSNEVSLLSLLNRSRVML